jgi:mevalonate kinase
MERHRSFSSRQPDGIGSAGGKVILAGEHAVLYRHPAIALGIDAPTHARAHVIDDGPSRLSVPALGVELTEDDDGLLARAFAAVLRLRDRSAPPVRVEVHTVLPPGGGLGFSAAAGVAVVRALDPRASDDIVLKHAMVWEGIIHGNASGIDALASVWGCCIYFRRGLPAEPLAFPTGAWLSVGYSGVGSRTHDMVSLVAARRAAEPLSVERILDAIGETVQAVRRALERADLRALGAALNRSHDLLRELGVSTPALDEMRDLALEVGAVGAKLTGSGGGGCTLAVAPSFAVADRICAAWRSEGYAGFTVEPASSTPALAVGA